MVTTPYAEGGSPPPTGTVVDNRTYAPFHQHFLVARLDLDVDGDDEHRDGGRLEARCRSPTDNPYGLAVVTEATPVASEAESARDFNWATQRAWKVVNPNRTNRHGTNPAYKLVPERVDPADDGSRRAAVPPGAGDRPHASG